MQKKIGLRMLWSYEMNEDSILAMAPLVRAELAQSMADAYENMIINGDNSTTHMDSDVTSSSDVRTAFQGLRKYSGNSAGNAAVDISTLSLDVLRNIEKAMGRFAANPAQRAWVTGISGMVEMMKIDETITIDKFGPEATIKQGQLAMLDGSPVIVSEFMRENLNASGVYDGVTMTKTEILLSNLPVFWTAQKPGGVMIETDRDIETQQNIAVASHRVDFQQSREPGSSEATVGVGYNLTS